MCNNVLERFLFVCLKVYVSFEVRRVVKTLIGFNLG